MTALNHRVVLKQRPQGGVTPDDFEVVIDALDDLVPGEVRVAVEYLSVDAGTRTMLKGEGFHQQVAVGDTILTRGVGRVVDSTVDEIAVGQAVKGRFGVQSLATAAAKHVRTIDVSEAPMSAHLGALGGTSGVTAWVGVREVAKPQTGEVFVVSAAAGAVGSLAGQIAKIDGATVIGIAGGAAKCAFLTETLGFDAAIDYKNEDVAGRLGELAPDGLNVFFDNVGGPILDAALDNLALRARVVICGAISQYDDMDNVTGPSLYLRLAERQSRMEGFAYFHFPDRLDAAYDDLERWVAEGRLVNTEHILEGIERYPEALQFMYEGGNIGKLLVKVNHG